MDHKPDLTIGGATITQHLERDRRRLVEAGLERIRATVPLYAALPAEQMGSDIALAIERGIHLVIASLATGGPGPEVLEEIGDSAALRAEEGIPLGTMVKAYLAGSAGVVEVIASRAGPGDAADVAAGVARALEAVGEAVAVAAERYVEEQMGIVGQLVTARRAVLADLLAGRRPDDTWTAAMPPRFAIAHLRMAPNRDEEDAAVSTPVAGRRKVRRVLAALTADPQDPPFEALSPDGGLVLLPAHDPDAVWSDLDRRVAEAAAAAGAPIVAAGAVVAPDEVADAARLVEELCQLAHVLGRDPGLYSLDDLVVEYQLTRPGPGRAALARRLAPLADHPELLATVREHLAGGLDRRRTARRLHLHPNSVDYRLKRAAALTGLDTTSRAAAWDVGTALVAWDAEARSAG